MMMATPQQEQQQRGGGIPLSRWIIAALEEKAAPAPAAVVTNTNYNPLPVLLSSLEEKKNSNVLTDEFANLLSPPAVAEEVNVEAATAITGALPPASKNNLQSQPSPASQLLPSASNNDDTGDTYILAALQIATSLAAQICVAEEEEEKNGQQRQQQELEDGNIDWSSLDVEDEFFERLILHGESATWQQPPAQSNQQQREKSSSLPSPNSHWADRIVVYLNDSKNHDRKNNCEHQQQQSPCSEIDYSSDAFERMLDSLFARRKGGGQVGMRRGGGENNDDSVLAVSGAELLLTPLNNDDDDTDVNDNIKLKRIQYLGLVFYELFSGGEKPPPSLLSSISASSSASNKLRKNPSSSHRLNVEKSSGMNYCDDNDGTAQQQQQQQNSDESDLLEPLPYFDDQGELDDLSTALSALDDLTNEDDDVGNGGFGGGGSGDRRRNECDDDIDDQPRKKKSAVLNSSSNISQTTTSVILSTKIPGPLCDLIGNMLDSARGEQSGSCEAYLSMSDVRTDLQLMLDQPDIFLRQLDLKELSTSELQLSKSLLGRESELSTLIGVYQFSLSGENKGLVFITGPSGTGKSFLSHTFGTYVTASGGIFLSAKFDQLRQARPLSALMSAFSQYCDILLKDDNCANAVASELRSCLQSHDLVYLTKMIPNLAKVLGQESRDSDPGSDDCIDSQKRLQFLLCQFVEVIAKSTSAPVAIFFDDLHWADSASIGVINQLFFTFLSTQRIFFLASSREGASLRTMQLKLEYLSLPFVELKMNNMDVTAINKTISETLHLSPRLTRPLSNIAYRKTKGNALFFSRWMQELQKEGLLRPSMSRRRWEWDEDKIRSRKLPDDVALFFTNSIQKLPTDVQKTLGIMACFGASMDFDLIEKTERALSTQLFVPLDVAVKEGLLDKIANVYRFSHDSVQAAAYDSIQPHEDRCLHHFDYGIRLANLSLSDKDDNILFAAANQLNLGGPKAVLDFSQSFTIATLNLDAGKKAMQMCDFSSAYKFFDHGISFLRKKHWQEHYDLSLQLFNLAAKCALANSEFDDLKIHSGQVLKHARTFEDKLNVLYFSLWPQVFLGQFSDAAKKTIEILNQLGEKFPMDVNVSKAEAISLIEHTRVTLMTYSISELQQMQRTNDPVKNMTMAFLAVLYQCIFMLRPGNLGNKPLVITKMVDFTLCHGMCEASPLAFTHFGHLLASLGNIEEGYRYANLAKSLVGTGSYVSAGEVVGWTGELQCFVEPVQATVPLFLEGYAKSMAAGDKNTACFNIMLYVNESYVSGVMLPELKERISNARKTFMKHNYLSQNSDLDVIDRHVTALMGVSSYSDDVNLSEGIDTSSPHSAFYCRMYSFFNSFAFRMYDASKQYAQQLIDQHQFGWRLMYGNSYLTFVLGLVSFWVHRVTKEPKWKQSGIKAKEEMRKWAESSKWNFEHQLLLLEAEESFCNGYAEVAHKFYDLAIKSANEHKFVHGEALANELCGLFVMESGRKDVAIAHFLRAHERYQTWGARGKATKLNEWLFQSSNM